MYAILLTLLTLASAQLPPSPDPGPIPIAGVVVDAASRPMADVDVWLAEALPPEDLRRAGRDLSWSALLGLGEDATPLLVHARTDARGRFALDAPAEAVARRSPTPLAVWAAAGPVVVQASPPAPGAGQRPAPPARVAFRRLPRIVLADDPPVRLELGPPARAEITLLAPGGKPVAGARVLPARVEETPVPEPLRRRLAATSDGQGRAVITGLAPESLGEVRVEAPEFGAQTIAIPDSGIPDPKIPGSSNRAFVLELAPVGRVVGRLEAPGDEPIWGVTIRAATQVGGYSGSGISGTGETTCDQRRRFEIPAIAVGPLALELKFDRRDGTTRRGEPPGKPVVQAGRTTEVAIPLRATVRVHGLAREKGTGRLIAGVVVVLNSHLGGDRLATTGVDGQFAGRIVGEVNQPFGWTIRIPVPFYEPADQREVPQGMPPRGADDLALPPTELPRGVEVRGSVTGEDDRPVAGAEVEVIWANPEGSVQAALARTDRAGSFTLHGVDPLAELNLAAWDGFAGGPVVTLRAEAAAARPIALSLGPGHTAPVAGRVVDTSGQPIAGTSVRLWRQVRARDGGVTVVDPVTAADGSVRLRTDAEGRYRTGGRLPVHGEYYAEASAPGRLSARSPALTPAELSRKPAVLVLRRVRTVAGRVVDSQGRPVAGALVRQSGDGPLPTEVRSDELGRFQLPGVLEGPALVFAQRTGFRFSFQTIDDESRALEVSLARTDEPPAVSYHSLPPALPVEEEKALARRLIGPLAAMVFPRGKDDEKLRFFREAAAVDPLAMSERLESIKFAIGDLRKLARITLAEELARANLDEATALLEASDSAEVRAAGYLGICDLRRDLRPDRVKELLVQAGVNARSLKSPEYRIPLETQIAGHWLDLGETGRARALLDDALTLARDATKGIKRVDYSLGRVAEVLARIDLPAGLKILDDLERDVRKKEARDRAYVFERLYGHIAYALAARAPADAERVLGRIAVKPTADRYVVAVCSRMAEKEPARARRIAETRTSRDAPGYKPYALGLMARTIAATDKAAAIRLLDEAYAALGQLADAGEQSDYAGLVEVAAALLPVVEQAEPDRLAEFLGRTLALRPARGDSTDRDQDTRARTTAALAAMMARYDRRLAAHLLAPELQETGTRRTSFRTDYATARLLAALALIDPRRAVEQVEALPDDPEPGTDPYATKNQARIQAARLLALHGAERWRHVYEHFLSLWTPDQRYL
jgi:protocatechuate 3,4-dioxygenase beta subunit